MIVRLILRDDTGVAPLARVREARDTEGQAEGRRRHLLRRQASPRGPWGFDPLTFRLSLQLAHPGGVRLRQEWNLPSRKCSWANPPPRRTYGEASRQLATAPAWKAGESCQKGLAGSSPALSALEARIGVLIGFESRDGLSRPWGFDSLSLRCERVKAESSFGPTPERSPYGPFV